MRLVLSALALAACSAPAGPPAEPAPLPPEASGPGVWRCYRIESDDRVSGCYRSASRCDAIRTEMAKRAPATACESQTEAACFSYWSETERRPLESCAATLPSCQARRQIQLRIAAGDTRQPTECEMWPAN